MPGAQLTLNNSRMPQIDHQLMNELDAWRREPCDPEQFCKDNELDFDNFKTLPEVAKYIQDQNAAKETFDTTV